jgi:hypothetical protein
MRSDGVGGATNERGHGGTLTSNLTAAFKEAQQNASFKPVVTADNLDEHNKIPPELLEALGIPSHVAAKFYEQLPIIEDGNLGLYKLPFGKNNFFWVVSAQSGDGSVENDYFSKFGAKSGHDEYGVG